MPEPILLLLAGAFAATFDVSAYWDGDGMYPFGITASGVPTAPGIVACGPAFPFGTLFVSVDGDMPHAADRCFDRGGAIHDGRIDVWMESRAAALRFGRRNVRMWVVVQEEDTCQ